MYINRCLLQSARHMPPTYVPATKCDAYVPHCARTVFHACCTGNVPRTIVIWAVERTVRSRIIMAKNDKKTFKVLQL